jgi:lipid II:glycine glycyltransferase (peptidoglycan interpeptide bridge formation enzyme)
MKTHIFQAIDTRQTVQWGKYLSQLGWNIERVGKTIILIKKIPFINKSVIKIQHPVGTIPFKEIEKIAKKYSAFSTLIEPHNVNYSEDNYKKNNYTKSNMRFAHSATIKIDLNQNEKELWSSLSENAKRNITKAKKNNLVIKKIFLKREKSDNQFDTFYNLLLELVKIKKFYIPSYDEYVKKMNAFRDTSVIIFAYEENGKIPIAAVWLAHYKNVITYLQTGITKKGYDSLANYLLVWEALKLGKKLKLEVFDFETIYDPRYPKENKRWIGYSEFKKRFHGEIIEYPPSWIKFHNKFFHFLYTCSTIFYR